MMAPISRPSNTKAEFPREQDCRARGTGAANPGTANPTGSVLAGSVELDLRPALSGKIEVDPRRRDIRQRSGDVDRQVVRGLAAKLLELLGVLALHPARRGHVDRLEYAVHVVLMLEAKGDDIELQHAYGADDDVVVVEGPEQLRCALLAQLLNALLQGLQ